MADFNSLDMDWDKGGIGRRGSKDWFENVESSAFLWRVVGSAVVVEVLVEFHRTQVVLLLIKYAQCRGKVAMRV